MTRGAWVVMLGIVGAAAGGCGSDPAPAPDLAGMYQIDHHTESRAVTGGAQATCAGEGPDVADPPFLQFENDAFVDQRLLAWGLCTSTDPATCSSEFYEFDDLGGGWKIGAATSASSSGGLCTLFHAEGSVIVVSEDPRSVQLEIKEWNAYPTDSPCTLEAAAALASQDDCKDHVVIDATLL